MTKAVMQLESYRLAQYAVPVSCYICDGDNNLDADLCRHCHAPMSLAQSSTNKKVQPQIISVLGSAGAGKTVYLGMLMDLLSRQTDQMEILARGAFSISLQQHTMSALERCEFPYKTPNEPDRWEWVNCQVRCPGRRRAVEMVMPDMAGEAINTELDHPNSFPVIHSLIRKCRGMIVLVDVLDPEAGGQGQDFMSMKMLTYLSELGESRRKKRFQRPLALVFTKADQCEACFDDPLAYARKHTPGLWKMCHEWFGDYRFFAASVAVRAGGGVNLETCWCEFLCVLNRAGLSSHSVGLSKDLRNEAGAFVMIEQAIFTSAKSGRMDGYHRVASSPGVAADDARALTVWSPAHDSLIQVDEVHAAGAGRRCGSTNFFPLPSGAYCVSRTVPAGAEYSGRRGARVYTQCLVVPAEVLVRFANNPFRLLDAAAAGGHLQVLERFPHQLKAISLPGRASTVDCNLVDHLSFDPGPRHLAGVLALAMSSRVVGIVGFHHPEQLIAGLITLTPPAFRTSFSFSTGLKLSPRRPFRLMAIEDSADERRRVSGVDDASIVDVKKGWHDESIELGGWARLVLHLLRDGSIRRLNDLFQKVRPDWTSQDLDAWAEQWLEQFGAPLPENVGTPATQSDQDREASMPASHADRCVPSALNAHAAHQSGRRPAADSEVTPRFPPSAALDLSCQSMMDKLEALDCTVLDAIQGDAEALAQLSTLWPEIMGQLGPELIEESREQYLQYALSAWGESADTVAGRDAARAGVALDVLTVLFDA